MPTKDVTLLFFAALRERVDQHQESIEVDATDTETLADLWDSVVKRHPELEGLRGNLRVAVDREMVEWDHAIDDIDAGAEVAFIPPVSGGSGAAPDQPPETRVDGAIAVTPYPLKPEQLEDYVKRPSAGGLVTFEGIVRNHTDGRPVEELLYEAYTPMAADVLADIHNRATTRWPEIKLAIHHRIGRLEVGDLAVVVTAASAHRSPSFEAVQWAIGALKQDAPIWKKENGEWC